MEDLFDEDNSAGSKKQKLLPPNIKIKHIDIVTMPKIYFHH